MPETSYAEPGLRSQEGATQDTIPNGPSSAVEQSVTALCHDKLGI